MRHFATFLYCLISSLFVWAMTAYALWEVDPGKWDNDWRLGAALMTASMIFCIAGARYEAALNK